MTLFSIPRRYSTDYGGCVQNIYTYLGTDTLNFSKEVIEDIILIHIFHHIENRPDIVEHKELYNKGNQIKFSFALWTESYLSICKFGGKYTTITITVTPPGQKILLMRSYKILCYVQNLFLIGWTQCQIIPCDISCLLLTYKHSNIDDNNTQYLFT